VAEQQQRDQRDFFTRLAEAGEDAIQRLGDAPGAGRFAQTLNGLRERVEEMQRKMRGIDVLEQRIEKLEQRLTALEKKTTTARRRTASSASKPARKAGET
jgi:DNA repair exonuclease SbcCD ATPase subunit